MKIKLEGTLVNLPDFLIIGAPKAGTTSLYYYLKNHPEVFMPDVKEPWFFSFKDNPPNFQSPDPLNGVISDIKDYVELFKNAKENQIIGEASPSYLYTYKTSIENIKEVYGDQYKNLRIIIILRDPVERAFSQYSMFLRNGTEPIKDFKKAIDLIEYRLKNNWNIFYDYIGFSLYYESVKSYLEEFKYVKILFFEEMKSNPEKFLNEIKQFLQLKIALKSDDVVYNVSGIPKNILVYPVYYFLYRDNFIKNILKFLLPIDLRTKIKSSLSKKILKKGKIDPVLYKEIYEKYFKEDQDKLKSFLKDIYY